MNRKRLIVVGVLALVVAGLVTLKLFQIVTDRLSSRPNQDVVKVVAAARAIEVGATVSEADLHMISVLRSGIPAGAFTNVQELVGRGVIIPVAENEILLPSKLASAESGAGLPSMIPDGMRAVSVKVNDVVAVAGFVVPGTRVDVLLTGHPGTQGGAAEVTTTTVLQNVSVLAAGQRMQRDPNGQPQNVPVITLLVSPDDAQKLTLASQEGRIQLALRNPLDLEKAKTAPVRNVALYAGAQPVKKKWAGAPAAVTLPAPYSVEVIRGAERAVSKF
jgi:pilus assembly protein CpaB